MNRPTLWVMCGLSGSGKSTIAKQLAQEHENTVIVSSDSVREELTGDYENQDHNEEVSKIFHKKIRENLENNKNVIADATNLTIKSRRATLEHTKGMDIERICYIIPKPFAQCKIDNQNREHPVPNEVLDKQIRRFQVPFMEEGWNDIQIYNLVERGCIPDIISVCEMEGFDQKNPHHKLDLYTHCKHVYETFRRNYAYSWFFASGAFFHDYGKMKTQTFDKDGIAHYFCHSNVGAYQFLTAKYHLSNNVLDECFVINYHMMPFNWTTEKSKERWKKRFGEYKYQMLLDFHECDKAR